MTDSVDIEYQVELEDGELVDLTLNVEYELIYRQPDVGIMCDYAEVLGVTVYEQEWKDNAEVLKDIEGNLEYIADKVDEEIL